LSFSTLFYSSGGKSSFWSPRQKEKKTSKKKKKKLVLYQHHQPTPRKTNPFVPASSVVARVKKSNETCKKMGRGAREKRDGRVSLSSDRSWRRQKSAKTERHPGFPRDSST